MVWSTKSHERYRARLCSRESGMRLSPGDQRSATLTTTNSEDGPGFAEGSGLLSKIRAFSEGWVIGSVTWVESFSTSNGWLGYKKEERPKQQSPPPPGRRDGYC